MLTYMALWCCLSPTYQRRVHNGGGNTSYLLVAYIGKENNKELRLRAMVRDAGLRRYLRFRGALFFSKKLKRVCPFIYFFSKLGFAMDERLRFVAPFFLLSFFVRFFAGADPLGNDSLRFVR